MGRRAPVGAKQFSAGQKGAYSALRDLLGLSDGKMATDIGWNPSSFSSCLGDRGTRAMNPERYVRFVEILQDTLDSASSQFDENVKTSAYHNFYVLFPETQDEAPESPGAQKPLTIAPGEPMPAHAANRCMRNVDEDAKRFVLGVRGFVSPRVWVLGGPKTGKTTFLNGIRQLAEESKARCEFVDALSIAINHQKNSGTAKIKVPHLLNELYQVWFRVNDTPFSDKMPDHVAFHEFKEAVVRQLEPIARTKRLIVCIDHLYQLGYLPGFVENYDILRFQLSTIQIPNCTLFLTDEGAIMASASTSQEVMRGEKCRLGSLNRGEVSALLELHTVERFSDKDIDDLIDALGQNIFLHHCAIMRAGEKSGGKPLKPADLRDSAEWVLEILSGEQASAGTNPLSQSINGFRRRVERTIEVEIKAGGRESREVWPKLRFSNEGGEEINLPDAIRRPFEWSGFVEEHGTVPGYVQCIAKRRTDELEGLLRETGK